MLAVVTKSLVIDCIYHKKPSLLHASSVTTLHSGCNIRQHEDVAVHLNDNRWGLAPVPAKGPCKRHLLLLFRRACPRTIFNLKKTKIFISYNVYVMSVLKKVELYDFSRCYFGKN